MKQPSSVQWFIPDAYIPPRSTGETSHESLCVLNPADADRTILIEALFEGDPPKASLPIVIEGRSCVHLRTDDPGRVGGLTIPRGIPYGMVVTGEFGLVVQYSRLDTSQSAYALMTVIPSRGVLA